MIGDGKRRADEEAAVINAQLKEKKAGVTSAIIRDPRVRELLEKIDADLPRVKRDMLEILEIAAKKQAEAGVDFLPLDFYRVKIKNFVFDPFGK